MVFLTSPFLGIFQQIGMPELLIIGFIVLLLFGAKRLPELFRSMGRSLGEFKKATREIEDEVKSAMDMEEDYSRPKPKTPAKTTPVTPAAPQGESQVPNNN